MSMTMWPRARKPSSRMSGLARAAGAITPAGAGRATEGDDGSGVIGPYATPAQFPSPDPLPLGRGWASDPEGVEARDVPAHDQGVDIVGALVRVHRLQVHHVPDDRVLVHDARRAQDVPREARAIERHLHVVHLGHRDLLRPHAALVLELAEPKAEELGLGDLGDHPHEL